MKIAPLRPLEICSVYGKYIHLIRYAKVVKMDIMVLPALLKHKTVYNIVERVTN